MMSVQSSLSQVREEMCSSAISDSFGIISFKEGDLYRTEMDLTFPILAPELMLFSKFLNMRLNRKRLFFNLR